MSEGILPKDILLDISCNDLLTFFAKEKGNLIIRLPFLVEHSGVEPLTSSMRTRRTTNCANAPYRNAMLLYSPLIKKSIPFFMQVALFPCNLL